MKRWLVILVSFVILSLLVGDIGGLAAVLALPPQAPTDEGTPSALPTITFGTTASSTPATMFSPTATRAPAKAPTLAPSIVAPLQTLPALYVDGPYIRRSDTHQPVWLKGVNVEEFRQRQARTLADLYATQGLQIVTAQGWGINLLRIMVDPELVPSTVAEIDKTITFAQERGMYVILAAAPSYLNPLRSEQRMAVPDDLVATAMGSLAAKFRDRTNVLYEIWNEPHPETLASMDYDREWQTWMQAGIKVAQAIRDRNPEAILVVPGGTKWARDLTYYRDHPFPFDSVIYDVHDYDAAPDYHYSRDMWTWVIGKYPLIIGEFGGNPIDPVDSRSIPYMQRTIQIANQNPGLVHYAMYVLSADGAWGIFTPRLQKMPRGRLLLNDLTLHAPTRFP